MSDDWQAQVKAAKGRMDRLEAAIGRALPKGAKAGATALRRESLPRVPVRRGGLKGSVFDEEAESGPTQAMHRMGYRQFYARFVDRGFPLRRVKGGPILKYIRPKPYFRNVARNGRARIGRAVVRSVRQSVRQEMRL